MPKQWILVPLPLLRFPFHKNVVILLMAIPPTKAAEPDGRFCFHIFGYNNADNNIIHDGLNADKNMGDKDTDNNFRHNDANNNISNIDTDNKISDRDADNNVSDDNANKHNDTDINNANNYA